MEQMKLHLSLQGLITGLLFLTAAGKGCDGPSAPQCFRTDSTRTMYICEWSSPYKDWSHYVHINSSSVNCIYKFQATRPDRIEIKEESVSSRSPVDIWVEANETSPGTSHCASEKTSVTLEDIIKYDKPAQVTVRWAQDNLTLQWKAPETQRAAVEIWHRKDSTQPWNKLNTTTGPKGNKYNLTVENLEKPSVQQLQMRQRSTKAKNPMWSDWSKILTVPIEFVKISKKLMNGTRRITLRWKPVPSSDGEAVLYQVETHSFRGCPYHKQHPNTSETSYITYGPYSAFHISVIANNAASASPPALFRVRPENPPNLKVCEARSQNPKKVCREWYEFRDERVKEDTVIKLDKCTKNSESINNKTAEMKDFLPYVYFDNRCKNRRPWTEHMCLYYKKQGKPVSHPPHCMTSAESPTSATLSWKPIPTEEQRGFITHYSLCIAAASAEGQSDCRNISRSLKSYTIDNLTPGTKYNISLKGVTSVGEGPPARITINTQPEKPYNVWLSFGLLIGFFFLSILCTFVFTRIKNQVLPPVPIPVIPEFIGNKAEVQDLLERKEEVHKVTLVQLHPECCPPEDTEKSTRLSEKPGEGSSDLEEKEEEVDLSSDIKSDHSPKDSEEPTDLVQNEIALLIYRNGLVFDVNVDSSGVYCL